MGHTATGYTGTIHFSSSDAAAGLPADYTFTPADQGVHTFVGVTLQAPGTATVSASDKARTSISGTSNPITVTRVASQFAFSGFPELQTAASPATFTLLAEADSGHMATAYTGTVHFTSSDPQALLPADYTFTAADQGQHTFSTTLLTAGSQTLFATDAAA